MTVFVGSSTPVSFGGVTVFRTVTPSDAAPLNPLPVALLIGGTGNLALKDRSGNAVTIPVTAGQELGLSPTYVMATGTTATGILGLYVA